MSSGFILSVVNDEIINSRQQLKQDTFVNNSWLDIPIAVVPAVVASAFVAVSGIILSKTAVIA